MPMKRLLYGVAIVALVLSCSAPKEKIPPPDSPEKVPGKMVVYQIMTRLFGNTVSVNKRYGTIAENGVGKFNDINEAALRALKEMGVTHVWYTGVIEHVTLTDYSKYDIPPDDPDIVRGRAGSPFVIKDYYDVDPDLADSVPLRMQEFEQLVARTHEAGLKVLIDFVPNHVARAYRSDAKPEGVMDLGEEDFPLLAFDPNNNFYYLPGEIFKVPAGHRPVGYEYVPGRDGVFEEMPAKATGNDRFTASPGINDWFETVKLNYGVDIQNGGKTHFDTIPNTWIKMRDILLFWAGKNVDGFRCETAGMVPVEFWNWAIPQVRQVNPEILFIAEIYDPGKYTSYLHDGRFDYLCDKVCLYDTLRLIVEGKQGTDRIPGIRQRLEGINYRLLHFLENHNEQRIASPQFAGDPWKGVPAMVISATIDRGPVMIYFGQEVGEPGSGWEGYQGDDGRTTIYDYWGVPEHQKWMNGGKFDGALLSPEQKKLRQFYIDLLTLVGNNAAISQGDYIDLTRYNLDAGNFTGNVHAFIRHYKDERLLIVNSFNTDNQSIKINLPMDVATRLGLNKEQTFVAKDLLWHETEVAFDKNLNLSLDLKPFSSFIFKIQ